MSDWGKGVINDIGWGQGANNDIGWGSIYDKSNAGETLLSGGGNTDAFIIEVKTDELGISNNDQFQFTGAEGDYDVVAKQGGVIVQTFSDLSDAATITFSNGVGTYILEVTPKEVNPFNRIEFANGGDKSKILDVKQLGNIVWSSFNSAFRGTNNMAFTATDLPNLSVCNDFRNAFRSSAANPDTTNWNMENIEDMFGMFLDNTNANPNVFHWNVSSLYEAGSMFQSATAANPNCRNWNVVNLNNANNMFLASGLSTDNLTAIYTNWSQLNLQQNVEFSAGSTKYNSSGQAGRDILVNTYNWIITDGSQV